MNSPDVRRWSIRDVLRQVTEMDIVDVALRLTLLDLLLRPIGNWAIRPGILSLAALGVLLPEQLRKPSLWLALTCLTSLRVVVDWPLPDNHAYLLCYWCFAVFLASACRLASVGSVRIRISMRLPSGRVFDVNSTFLVPCTTRCYES